jgi:hypothetical protein
MNELWIKCIGFEQYLEVSNLGRVRTLDRLCKAIRCGKEMEQFRKGKIISQYVAKNGYPEIAIKIDGKRKKINVHRLVAKAFVPGFIEGLTVNHINGIKTQNIPNNLEWVTLSKNSQLEWETGLVNLRGDNHPNCKLSSGKVRIIRDLISLGATCNSLSVLLDVDPTLIYMIRDGKRWSSII